MSKSRRSSAHINAIRKDHYQILIVDKPMSVRQVFYRVVVAGLVDKTEADYKGTVARLLVEMRREGTIPYDWIADGTRWMRCPAVYAGLDAFIERHQSVYRRDIWAELDEYVEIWVEKEALAGIIYNVTSEYGVPLMVSRGFASESYLYSAAETITDGLQENKRRACIYYFGDYDLSGLKIGESIEAGLRRLCRHVMKPSITEIDRCMEKVRADVEPRTDKDWLVYNNTLFDDDMLEFTRAAVTPEQIETMSLPTRPTKIVGNSHARDWDPDGHSVELDTIPPKTLRAMVEDCISNHVDPAQIAMLRKIEAEERKQLDVFAKSLRG